MGDSVHVDVWYNNRYGCFRKTLGILGNIYNVHGRGTIAASRLIWSTAAARKEGFCTVQDWCAEVSGPEQRITFAWGRSLEIVK